MVNSKVKSPLLWPGLLVGGGYEEGGKELISEKKFTTLQAGPPREARVVGAARVVERRVASAIAVVENFILDSSSRGYEFNREFEI